MPLIDDEPPSSLPRGIGMRRWPVDASGSEAYSQFALGLAISLAKPTGIHDQGWLSRRFQQQHLVPGGGAQPVRQHRAGADDDEVKAPLDHFSPRGLHRSLVCSAGRDWEERGLAMPRRLELPHELAEAFEIGALQLCPLRFGKGQRIDRLAVFDDLEMEMWARRPPGIAD